MIFRDTLVHHMSQFKKLLPHVLNLRDKYLIADLPHQVAMEGKVPKVSLFLVGHTKEDHAL